MEKALSNLLITIVEDGGTVTVGDKTFNVTLAEAVTNEITPVEGKWYRYVKEKTRGFTPNRWYVSTGAGNSLYSFKDDLREPNGFGSQQTNREYFDLSTPLDFDPETLVGKTLEWGSGSKVVVTKIEYPYLIGIHLTADDYSHWLLNIIESIQHGSIKIIDPEPTLTVPENVEFVDWHGDIALSYNGFLLSQDNSINTFALTSTQDFIKALESRLQLVPCKLSEVQNGELVVNKEVIDNPIAYRLKTEKGWVSFDVSDEYPIEIEKELSDLADWLKVVRE